MNTRIRLSSLLVALLVAGAASAGTSSVTFANSEHFSDLPNDPLVREQVLVDLTEHFRSLAAKLPAGQDLKVDVTDIDLAGHSWPFWGTRELRVLDGGADWPHMKLHYTLSQDGTVIKSGDELVQNMAYLTGLNRYSTGDSLRYEKQMLDSWYRAQIAGR